MTRWTWLSIATSLGLDRLIEILNTRFKSLEQALADLAASVVAGGGGTSGLAGGRFTALVGTGVGTSFMVTHDLGTRDVIVEAFDEGTGATVECSHRRLSPTAVRVTFTAAPAVNAVRVVVLTYPVASFLPGQSAGIRHAETIGDGVASTLLVTHVMGVRDVIAQAYDVNTGDTVGCDVLDRTTSTCRFRFTDPPPTASVRVVLLA